MRKSIATLVAIIGLVGAGATAQAAGASSSCYYSPRGCVQVRGYYKPSTRTYVRPYVRNYPGYGRSSYRSPSSSYRYRSPSSSYRYRSPSSTYRSPSSSYSSGW